MTKPQTLAEWATFVHEQAIRKGWWEQPRPLDGLLALVHSEVSEALESWRTAQPPFWWDGEKPEGWAVELVDTVIRVLDILENEGVDIQAIMERKTEYNDTRPHRHGGKRS